MKHVDSDVYTYIYIYIYIYIQVARMPWLMHKRRIKTCVSSFFLRMGNRIAFILEVPQACSNAIGAAGSFYYYARVAKLKCMFYINHMAEMLCFRRILRFLQKSLRILQTSHNSEKDLRILQTSLRTFAEITESFTEISKCQKSH